MPDPDLMNILHSRNDSFRILCYETLDGYMVPQYTYPPVFCLGFDNVNTAGQLDFELWQPAHDYAVALTSTIHVDLGNPRPKNLLTSPDYMQRYSEGFQSINEAVMTMVANTTGWWPTSFELPTRTYEELRDSTGPLGISPAVIFSQYTCQVPKMRSVGSLIISVFIADLVILSAAWTLLNFGTTFWLEHRHEDAMYCTGCLELRERSTYEAREVDYSTPSPGLNMPGTPLDQLTPASETVSLIKRKSLPSGSKPQEDSYMTQRPHMYAQSRSPGLYENGL